MLQKSQGKWVVRLICFMIAIGIVVGCNGGEKNVVQKVEELPSASNPMVIEYLAYDTYGEPDPNSEIVKKVEDIFNVKLKFWFIDNHKFDEVLNLRLSSGEMPDVLKLTRQARANLGQYVKMGVLSELPQEKVRHYAPNFSAYVDGIDPSGSIWDIMTYDGKNYGWTVPNQDGMYPTLLIWRMDWLRNIGYHQAPETLAEFEDVIYQFRNQDPDQNGKQDTYGLSNTAFSAIFGAFGVKGDGLIDFKKGLEAPLIKKDGKVLYQAIQPEVKDALALMQKWYKDGVIDPEFITGENEGGYWAISHGFINNRIGVTGNVMFYHYLPPDELLGTKGGMCYNEIIKANPDAMLGFGNPPIGPDGKMGTHSWGAEGFNIALTSKALKDEEKVKTILGMWDLPYIDEEYALMTQWGFEGIDYEVVEHHVKTLGSPLNAREMREKGLLVFPTSEKTVRKYRENYYTFAEQVSSFPSYPAVILPTPEEAAKVNNTLAMLTQEAFVKIITGEKQIDYFDEFVNQFLQAGGQEAQDAYNQ